MVDFPYDIVGFDLDGTLLDTSIDLGHALNHALAVAGRPPVPLDDVARHIGGGSSQMLRSALAESGGIDQAAFPALQDELIAFYARNIAHHTRFFPGGLAMLDALAARGVKLVVVTNKKESLALSLFAELGILERFVTVIGGDTLGPGKAKPAPDLILEMIKRCGGERAAFVGDTTYDVRAARAAGIPVVAVSFGFCDAAPADLGADAVIDRLGDLEATLLRLGGG